MEFGSVKIVIIFEFPSIFWASWSEFASGIDFFDVTSRFVRFWDGLGTIFGEIFALFLNSSDFVQLSTKHCVGA